MVIGWVLVVFGNFAMGGILSFRVYDCWVLVGDFGFCVLGE